MASFYMIFSDEDDEEFGDKNNPMADPADGDPEAQANYKKYGGDDDDEDEDKTDSENMNWEVLTAKLVTAYKVINQQNTIIGRLGFAVLLSDKRNLKIILYRSKIDLLSSVILRESNKIYVKGNFIQYLDSSNNFWSILFENENDRDEAIKLLEERCTIEWVEMESSIKTNDSNSAIENENQEEKDAKNDGTKTSEDATCDKSVETDPEEKQGKQLKANILSRMAKMGKRLVPSGGSNKASDVSDSEGESPKRQPIARRPNTATSSPVLQIAKLHPSPHVPHTVEFRQGTHNNSVVSAASSDSSLNNLLMMQNTEIRFNLSKLDTKLDKLCDKIEVLSTSGSLGNQSDRNNDSLREEDIVRLEEKLIAVKRENLSLKSIIRDLEEVTRTANSQHSTNELNELKVQIKALTHENKEYKKHIIDLSEQNERIQVLEGKLKNSLEANERAEIQLKTKDADLGEIKSQLHCSKRFAEDLQASLDEIVKQRDSQKNIAYATKEIQTMMIGEASKSTENHLQENHVKEMMNSLYFKLCERISNTNELKDRVEVLKVIGVVIKQETQETLRKNVAS